MSYLSSLLAIPNLRLLVPMTTDPIVSNMGCYVDGVGVDADIVASAGAAAGGAASVATLMDSGTATSYDAGEYAYTYVPNLGVDVLSNGGVTFLLRMRSSTAGNYAFAAGADPGDGNRFYIFDINVGEVYFDLYDEDNHRATIQTNNVISGLGIDLFDGANHTIVARWSYDGDSHFSIRVDGHEATFDVILSDFDSSGLSTFNHWSNDTGLGGDAHGWGSALDGVNGYVGDAGWYGIATRALTDLEVGVFEDSVRVLMNLTDSRVVTPGSYVDAGGGVNQVNSTSMPLEFTFTGFHTIEFLCKGNATYHDVTVQAVDVDTGQPQRGVGDTVTLTTSAQAYQTFISGLDSTKTYNFRTVLSNLQQFTIADCIRGTGPTTGTFSKNSELTHLYSAVDATNWLPYVREQGAAAHWSTSSLIAGYSMRSNGNQAEGVRFNANCQTVRLCAGRYTTTDSAIRFIVDGVVTTLDYPITGPANSAEWYGGINDGLDFGSVGDHEIVILGTELYNAPGQSPAFPFEYIGVALGGGTGLITASPPAAQPYIVWLGDSTCVLPYQSGSTDTPLGGWPFLVGITGGKEVWNAALSGTCLTREGERVLAHGSVSGAHDVDFLSGVERVGDMTTALGASDRGVLSYGHNDVFWLLSVESEAAALAHWASALSEFLTTFTTDKPLCHLDIIKIIPSAASESSHYAAFDAQSVTTAAGFGNKVRVIDISTGTAGTFVHATHTSDGTHPNELGRALLAANYLEAIGSVSAGGAIQHYRRLLKKKRR